MLDVLARARQSGDLPEDLVPKVSLFTGHGNPASIRLLEGLGADNLNPLGDVSRPMLSSIRQAVQLPLDIYAFIYESFGGMNRLWEAAEIVRVASPVYFKIEPGESEGALYGGWADAAYHDMHVAEKVRYADIMRELIERESQGALGPSPRGEDQRGVPV